jgi:DNA anti-recombination protein RmuC
MLKLIKEYLKLSIFARKSFKKEMNEINKCIKQLYEITGRQETMFSEYADKSYKTRFKKEHEKLIEMEREYESR